MKLLLQALSESKQNKSSNLRCTKRYIGPIQLANFTVPRHRLTWLSSQKTSDPLPRDIPGSRSHKIWVCSQICSNPSPDCIWVLWESALAPRERTWTSWATAGDGFWLIPLPHWEWMHQDSSVGDEHQLCEDSSTRDYIQSCRAQCRPSLLKESLRAIS